MKKASNEQITAALLNHGTIKAAAASLGMTYQSIYERLKRDGELQAIYKTAKADLLKQTLHELTQQSKAATDTIAEIMTDKGITPAIRLNAATATINSITRLVSVLNDVDIDKGAEDAQSSPLLLALQALLIERRGAQEAPNPGPDDAESWIEYPSEKTG